MAGAGVTIADVDGLNVVPGLDYHDGTRRYGYQLGIPIFWVGCAAPGAPAVIEAATAIEAGICDTAVVASGQAAVHTDKASVAPWARPSNEFIECWGLHTPAELALSARQHMAKYGIKDEQIAY